MSSESNADTATARLLPVLLFAADRKILPLAHIMIFDLDEKCKRDALAPRHRRDAALSISQGNQNYPEWAYGVYSGLSITEVLQRHGILFLNQSVKLAVRAIFQENAAETHEVIHKRPPVSELSFASGQSNFYQTSIGVYVIEETQGSFVSKGSFWILKKMSVPAAA